MSNLRKPFLLFLLVGLVCSACPANCGSCPDGNTCTSCLPGFQLFQDNTCLQAPTLQGCQVYANSQTCSSCIPGYNLFTGICYPPVANCEGYGPGNVCVRCQVNYTVVNGRCELANNTVCTGPGQALNNGVCLQITASNCQGVASNVCTNCVPGYRLMNGLCFRIGEAREPACQSVLPNNACGRCVPPYYLDRGVCLNVTIDNCLRSDGIICFECAPKYNLNNGACFRTPKEDDPNCNVIDIDTGACTGCNFQYFLNSSAFCIRRNLYCQSYDQAGLCTSCPQRLRLQNGFCVYFDSNCQSVDYENRTCLSCKTGYFLNPVNSSCVLINACNNVSSSGICQGCSSGYQLISTQCYSLPNNCLQLDSQSFLCNTCNNLTNLSDGYCIYYTFFCMTFDRDSGICSKCYPQYYLRQRQCVAFPANCRDVNQFYRCRECNQGYALYSGACVSQSENCVSYGPTGCRQCNDGFYLMFNRCVAYPPNCLYLSNQGRCVRCRAGTVVYNGRCVRYQVFCLNYDQNGDCNSVPRDFYLSASNVTHYYASQWDENGNFINCRSEYFLVGTNLVDQNCVKIVDNCNTYDQMSNCRVCNPVFALNLTRCAQAAGTCLSVNSNACERCADEYVLVNGSCYNRRNFAASFNSAGMITSYMTGYNLSSYGVALALNFNCIRQDFVTGTCQQCARYFTLLNNSCVMLDSYCIAYNARGICQTCTNGYRFIYGVCRPIANCAQNQTSGPCTLCRPGFLVSSGTCYPQPTPNCAFYDINLVCQGCSPGFFLTRNNTCANVTQNCRNFSQDGKCIACFDGFQFSTSGQCYRLVENCLNYNQNGQCRNCAPRYQLSNNSCVALPQLCQTVDPDSLRCTQCLPGFVLVNNGAICAMRVENCVQWNVDGTCRGCAQGYILNRGRCQLAIANCAEYGQNQCLRCNTPYILVNNTQCRLPVQNCRTYSPSGLCTQCNPGFYFLNSQCSQNPPNCAIYSPVSNTCTRCSEGFFLRNNTCVFANMNMSGCAVVISPVECRSCFPGYTLTADSLCRATICDQFSSQGVCVQCPPRFQLTSGICIGVNCTGLDGNTQVCTGCAAGFELYRDNGLIYCRATNCRTYNRALDCIDCNTGYYVNNNVCSISNCQLEQNYTCFGCRQSYTLRGGICVIQNCANRSDTGCVACLPGFYLQNGVCVRDPRCSSISGGFCLSCNAGYVLGSDGLCRLGYCQQPISDLICGRCVSGFTLSNGVCISVNCISSNAQGCTQCAAGYALSNSTCVIANCAQTSPNRDFCQTCNPGFDPYNSLCRASNCSLLQPNSLLCSQCSPRYTVSSGSTCLAKNCSSYDTSNRCSICQSDFRQIGGFCTILNCLRSDDNYCLECYPGYEVNGNGTCTLQGCEARNGTDCVRCRDRFRLQRTVNGVICVSYYCDRVTTINGVLMCVTCLPGYVLYTDGYCYLPDPCRTYGNGVASCTSCIVGYTLTFSTGVCTARNCLYLDNWNYCIQCVEGYQLRNYTCIALNCLRYYQDNQTCLQCISGYSLQSDGSCRVTNCNFLYNGQCISCLPGYTLQPNSNLCSLNPCATFDNTNTTCVSCIVGFSFRNGVCVADFCQSSSDPTNRNCSACKPGFRLNNGTCISEQTVVIAGCLVYNYLNWTCEQCVTGFSLTRERYCQARWCRLATQYGCMECERGYVLTANSTRCLAQFCISYDQTTYQCFNCSANYSLSAQGTCVFVPPLNCSEGQYEVNRTCQQIPIRWCIRYDSISSRCTQCNAITTLVNNRCLNLANCINYTDNGCQQCRSGYYLSNSICVFSSVQGCDQSDNSGNCLNCTLGYIFSNGTCQSVSQNCLQYDSSGCVLCRNGFYNISGMCYVLPDNCRSLQSPNVCNGCIFGFTLVNRACIRNQENCNAYNQSGCKTCFAGYNLTRSGICVLNVNGCTQLNDDGTCSSCGSGLVLVNGSDGRVRACVRVVEGCTEYNLTGCTKCKEGYRNVLGDCTQVALNCSSFDANGQCRECGKGFYLSRFQNTTICIPNPIGCDLVVNNFCTNCSINYTLVSGSCYRDYLIQNCQSFNTTFAQCTQCKLGYYLATNRSCTALSSNCLSGYENNCNSCAQGYDLFNNFCYKSIANCSQYNSTTSSCISCYTGNFLSNNTCITLPNNCINVSSSGCTQCRAGFTLQDGICYRNQENCARYNTNGSCSQCSDGWNLTNSVCLLQNCVDSTRGRCLRCAIGYILTASGFCVSACASADPTACSSCAPGYTLYNSVCYFTILNCGVYDPSSGNCLNCSIGYYLSQQTKSCQLLPTNCAAPNFETGACVSCLLGFTLTNGMCIVPPKPLFCDVGDGQGGCSKCMNGYYPYNKKCVLLSVGCKVADEQGCVSCDDGFYMLAGTKVCLTGVRFCEVHNIFGGCSKCQSGYNMVNNMCTQTLYCRLVVSNGACVACISGFRLQNNSCLPTDSNCQLFFPNGTCSACLQNYTLTNGVCLLNTTSTYNRTNITIQFCTSYNAQGFCTACANGYLITKYFQCIVPVANCIDYDTETNLCSRCLAGYFLLEDYSCGITQPNTDPYCLNVNRGVCVGCVTGYALNVNRVCVGVLVGCVSYGADGRCLGCGAGFALREGRCVRQGNCVDIEPFTGRCRSCPIGFTLVNSTACVLTIVNCQDYDISGSCSRCISGCTLINNSCIQNPPNCARATSTGGCQQCNTGFILNSSGICVLNQPPGNCRLYVGPNCIECIVDFSVSNGNCVVTIPNCRQYGFAGQCLACQQGYNFTDGGCRLPNNCRRLDVFGGCAECNTGFALIGGVCQRTIENCRIFGPAGTCSVCIDGFYWNTNQAACVRLPANCRQSDNFGFCQQCIGNFALSNGKCFVNIPYCVSYNDFGLCTGCITGFTIFQTVCSPLPANCLRADFGLQCQQCAQGYILSNGLCINNLNPIPNCQQYDSVRNTCLSCKFLYYLNIEGKCVPYPSNCVSVDQLGNCLDCCYGSYLQLGVCRTFSLRSDNCDSFDQLTGRCSRCTSSFDYSISCGNCVKLDPNCFSFTTFDVRLCTACNSGYYLLSGMCLNSPPGLESSINGVVKCRPTYVLVEGKCYKNISLTLPMSNKAGTRLIYSSVDPSLPQPVIPRINGPSYWSPAQDSSGEYVGFRGQTASIIQGVQIQGNGNDEWVSGFTLRYRDSSSDGSELKCYQSCAPITGNTDSSSVTTVSFEYPIVARQIRLYPVTWTKGMGTRLQFLTD